MATMAACKLSEFVCCAATLHYVNDLESGPVMKFDNMRTGRRRG
jgi:hypothetical protein